MGESLSVWGVSLSQIRVYYLFVFISFIYLIFKFRKNNFSLFIVFLFYQGLFSFISKDVQNIYKIALALFSLYYLVKSNSIKPVKKTQLVFLSFILFSLAFLYSSYINDDYFFIVFSQYSRYFVLFSLFIIGLNIDMK